MCLYLNVRSLRLIVLFSLVTYMVKQRKSKGSDTLQSPGEVATPDLTISPTKKAKTNGLLEEDGLEASDHKENGGTPKTKKAKSLTIGELAERKRIETEATPQQISGASLAVQLTQGLMSNDALKLDSVLREARIEVIQATLLDLQVSHVVPLLKALYARLSNRSAINIKLWILWIQCILSLHASYLSSIRNLETELSGLLEWMRQRIGHQQKLLELHGRLSIIGEQIARRMNRTAVVAPQPLIVFNDDAHSDVDDVDSGGSDESGVSSDEEEEEWWDEGGLGAGDEDANEDDNDSDDDSDIDQPTKKRNGDSDGSATDDDDLPEDDEHGGEGSDDDEEDEMDIG
ncbi:Utp12 domain-containing protein [Trichostrongylus colubriformis]|uniref:Utp12 domain-containing protein n=1 Tax=Trichostrongylus colubriformis TaxID=6319 RepID=A0AAN8FV75_TRICO